MTSRIEEYRLILIALLSTMLLMAGPVSVGANPTPSAPYQKKRPPQKPAQKQPLPQQPAPEPPPPPPPPPSTDVFDDFDILGYRIDAAMNPETNALQATTAVTLRVSAPTRSTIFELHGALRVTAVRGPDSAPLQFIQNTLDEYTLKVDLGQVHQTGQVTTITIDYAGQLVTAEGGPLPDKRVAYVGPEGSYLAYSARWFPFHQYGADRAVTSINLTVPSDWKVAAQSDVPATTAPGKLPRTTVHTMVQNSPVLGGTIAAGPYIVVPVQGAGFQVDFYALPGSEGMAQKWAEEASQILDFYKTRFGPYTFGTRYVMAQTDDETLDNLTGAGIELISTSMLRKGAELPIDDLARQIALQWWGQTVGLVNFDATWLSQGLAQYSSLLYRQQQQSAAAFQATLADYSERALAYESDASIVQAPSQLNDQTPAFRSIILYKGAYVFRMLQETLGDEKFFALLGQYYTANKGKNVSIADFEQFASRVAGKDLRGFFALWVESTGVPEFTWNYEVLRVRAGGWKVRGTLLQSIENFRMPVEVLVTSSGQEEKITLEFDGTTQSFTALAAGQQPLLMIDPDRKILRVSDSIRVAVVVRRAIQEMEEGNYIAADDRFHDAIKLAPRSSWAWYNLGLLYMKQNNWQKATDAFRQALAGDKDPTWVEVWSHIQLGNAYDARGERERAVAEYDKAIENGNDYDGAQQAAQQYRGTPYRPSTK